MSGLVPSTNAAAEATGGAGATNLGDVVDAIPPWYDAADDPADDDRTYGSMERFATQMYEYGGVDHCLWLAGCYPQLADCHFSLGERSALHIACVANPCGQKYRTPCTIGLGIEFSAMTQDEIEVRTS
jgi:hypothetical protein